MLYLLYTCGSGSQETTGHSAAPDAGSAPDWPLGTHGPLRTFFSTGWGSPAPLGKKQDREGTPHHRLHTLLLLLHFLQAVGAQSKRWALCQSPWTLSSFRRREGDGCQDGKGGKKISEGKGPPCGFHSQKRAQHWGATWCNGRPSKISTAVWQGTPSPGPWGPWAPAQTERQNHRLPRLFCRVFHAGEKTQA